MMFSRYKNLLYLLTVLYPAASHGDSIPFVIRFDGEFGPDGPWHGVSALVGTGSGQSVHLYPAVQAFASIVLSTEVCNGWNGPGDCPALAGGLYNVNQSTDVGGIAWQADDASANILNDLFIDQNVLNGQAVGEHTGINLRVGGSSVNSNIVSNSSFVRLDQANFTMPNGASFPPTLGFLSLGAPDSAQVFTLGEGSAIVLPIPLNYLSSNDDIPSTSWSMHIGSAKLGQSGSMVWGGFDQSRVAGPVATYDSNGDSSNFMKFQLNDIYIGVGDGTNPLGYKTGNKTGLLVTNTTTSGNANSIPVTAHSEVPYMYLPKATCDKIAAELPMKFNSDYGLYIWDTDTKAYNDIVNSPAYLGFSFDYNTAAGAQIKVPFSLLALDLRQPITPDNLTYFPCRPHEPMSNTGSYVLGRAFLQAAFIAQSWRAGKYWLAQAPGPGGGTTNTVTIKNDTVTLDVSADKDAWVNSWSGTWKVNTTVIPGGTTPTSHAQGDNNGGSSSGLSSGAKTGIGIGVALSAVALALAALGWWLLTKKKRERKQSNFADMPTPSGPPTSSYPPTSTYAPTSYAGSYHPGHESTYNNQYQPVGYVAEAEGHPVHGVPPHSPGPYQELEGTTVQKWPSPQHPTQ